MKIGIDLFSFDKPGENLGVGPSVYVWKLLPKIIEMGKDNKFVIFANRQNYSLIPQSKNVEIHITIIPNKPRIFRIIYEQFYLPIILAIKEIDIIHYLGNSISFFSRRNSVLTVYDLMWDYYLKLGYKNFRNLYFKITATNSIKNANKVITISKFVGDEIISKYSLKKDKVRPILLAPGSLENFDKTVENKLKSKYSFDYLYTVTTSYPHKNLILLLKAFNKLKVENKFGGKLVISGQMKGEFYYSTFDFINKNNLNNEIISTGFISEKEKSFLYKNAKIFVYPSLYEGFGLPILEAYQSETVVIASNAASIPEVGGTACLYFNPLNENELADNIIKLLNDDTLRNNLIMKSKQQLLNFSWEKVAKETFSVYNELMNNI